MGFPFGILRLWDLGTSNFQDLLIFGFQVSWDLRIFGFVWFLTFFFGFFGLHSDPPIPRSGDLRILGFQVSWDLRILRFCWAL